MSKVLYIPKSSIMLVEVGEGSPNVIRAELVGLKCPVCDHVDNYPLKYPTDIWAWSLNGSFQTTSLHHSILDKLDERAGRHVCKNCTVESGLEHGSVLKLRKYIKEALEGLPFEGTDWAMQSLENFMSLHLGGNRNCRYHSVEPEGHAPGHVYHRWLLDYCPCERCTKARRGRPPHKEAMDITLYPSEQQAAK